MPTYWMVILAVASIFIFITVGIKIYWSMLLAFFPHKERASEVHTVVTRDMWELQAFRYRRGRTSGEPILLVHGMGANHHNFTEPEGACLVDELVGRGFDCWVIDTRLCRSAKPAFERERQAATIDDVLLYDMPAMVRYIRKNTSYGRVHWIGHSLGGMLLYAYVQHWGPAFLASGTTLGAPIGFDGTKLKIKLRHLQYLKKNSARIADIARGLVPILFYSGIGTKLFPMNMKNLHPKLRANNLFGIIEDPVYGAMDQLARWAQGKTWTMLEGKLDVKAGLKSMQLPFLTIFAPRDPFVPTDRAKAFFNALPSTDKQFLVLSKENGCKHDYDHCDMAFGVDGPRMVYGPIAKWIEAHPIAERVRAEEVTDDDIPIRGLLDAGQRAGILSGQSFAHLAPEPPVAAKAPAPFVLEIERIEEAPVAKAAPKTASPVATPVAKKKAPPARTPAAKATAKSKPAPKKPVAKKAAVKKTAAPKTAAKITAPKATAPAKKKAAFKPAPAPKKPAPAPKSAAKAATPAKAASPTPRVKIAPSKLEKHKPSRLTQSAILSASEALKDLDRKK